MMLKHDFSIPKLFIKYASTFFTGFAAPVFEGFLEVKGGRVCACLFSGCALICNYVDSCVLNERFNHDSLHFHNDSDNSTNPAESFLQIKDGPLSLVGSAINLKYELQKHLRILGVVQRSHFSFKIFHLLKAADEPN